MRLCDLDNFAVYRAGGLPEEPVVDEEIISIQFFKDRNCSLNNVVRS